MAKTAALNVVRKKLSEVKPNPKNPRVHPDEQKQKLDMLLERFGFSKGSMVIQKGTPYLLAGHGVYDTLTKQGYTEADFIIADLEGAEALAFMIADNKVAEDSIWDDEILNANFAELDDMGVELDATGFEKAEIDDLQPIFHPTNGLEQPRLDQKTPVTCPECGHEFIT